MSKIVKRILAVMCLLLIACSSVTVMAQDYSADGSKAKASGGISFYGGNEKDDPTPPKKPSTGGETPGKKNPGSQGLLPKTGEFLTHYGLYIILILSILLTLYIYKYKKTQLKGENYNEENN